MTNKITNITPEAYLLKKVDSVYTACNIFTNYYVVRKNKKFFFFIGFRKSLLFNIFVPGSPEIDEDSALFNAHKNMFLFLSVSPSFLFIILIYEDVTEKQAAIFLDYICRKYSIIVLFTDDHHFFQGNRKRVCIEDLKDGLFNSVNLDGTDKQVLRSYPNTCLLFLPDFFSKHVGSYCIVFWESFDKYQHIDLSSTLTPLNEIARRTCLICLPKTFKGLRRYARHFKLFKFKLSFEDWWRYLFSVQSYILHPRARLFKKLNGCGYDVAEFELNDNPIFLYQIITKGFETVAIECSYTYQPIELVDVRRIILGVAFKKKDSASFSKVTNTLLSMMSAYNAVLVDTRSSDYRHRKVYTLPNKVSRSVWTQDLENIKKLGDVSNGYSFILASLRKLLKGKITEEKDAAEINIDKDLKFIREFKMDFIYIFPHHNPFTEPFTFI